MYALIKSALNSFSCSPAAYNDDDDLSQSEVRCVCRATVNALKRLGLSSCVYGRAACRLYGAHRSPDEIEIIVLTHRFGWTTDHILNQIVLHDPSESFFLAPAPALVQGGEEKELWFTLRAGRAVRVHVCVPRLLLMRSAPNVPPIPPACLCTVHGIPVMPLVPLLLLRLQSRRPTRAEREDISDVMHLLERARGGVAREVRRAKRWLPPWFIAAGRSDVERYCTQHGLAYQASWFDLEAWLLDSDDEGNDERE